MENFTYYNKTKIIFGRGVEKTCGQECRQYGTKVLLHYGGGSIKKSGLYDRVVASLKEAGMTVYELGGVQPNPVLSLVHKGIDLVKANGIEIILAVGGGSVIDSAKGIALGAKYDGEVWDFYSGKVLPKAILPLGTILTIPAAGSESSFSTVITNEDGLIKKSYRNDLNRPLFSFMNPELIATVPPKQMIAGSVDIFSHILERYFTNATHVDLTDELCEGTFRALIKNAPLFISEPTNYDYASEVMWTSTIAHNSILDTGRIADWGSHMIEHELSALYDVTHGLGLAIIVPAWMKYVYHHDIKRFARFANKVWGVAESNNLEEMATIGIAKTQRFFETLGAKTSLADANIPCDQFELMASKATKNGPIGKFVPLYKEDVINIYKLAK